MREPLIDLYDRSSFPLGNKQTRSSSPLRNGLKLRELQATGSPLGELF